MHDDSDNTFKLDMRQYCLKTNKIFKSRQNRCGSHGRGSIGGKRKSTGRNGRKGCQYCKGWHYGYGNKTLRRETSKQIVFEMSDLQ